MSDTASEPSTDDAAIVADNPEGIEAETVPFEQEAETTASAPEEAASGSETPTEESTDLPVDEPKVDGFTAEEGWSITKTTSDGGEPVITISGDAPADVVTAWTGEQLVSNEVANEIDTFRDDSTLTIAEPDGVTPPESTEEEPVVGEEVVFPVDDGEPVPARPELDPGYYEPVERDDPDAGIGEEITVPDNVPPVPLRGPTFGDEPVKGQGQRPLYLD